MYYCVMYALPSLRGEKISSRLPQKRILVPLRGFFENLGRAPPSPLYGFSPGEGPRCFTHFAERQKFDILGTVADCHVIHTCRIATKRKKSQVPTQLTP